MLRAVDPDWLKRERSIDVATAADILGCDRATVRKLVRKEILDAHKVGANDDEPAGVRVNLQSVLDYKARHRIGKKDGDRRSKTPARRRREATADQREAIATLRALGSRAV